MSEFYQKPTEGRDTVSRYDLQGLEVNGHIFLREYTL